MQNYMDMNRSKYAIYNINRERHNSIYQTKENDLNLNFTVFVPII